MRRCTRIVLVPLLACGWLFLLLPQVAHAQIGGMTCIECHADPLAGGFHGGFRPLSNLTNDQIDVVCLSCHDGSYTNPQGVPAPEAAVHQNKNPGAGRDEYGDFKAGCRDCHTTHSPLLAGDESGNTNLKLLGPPVPEAVSTDGIARIRRPIIVDPNGDDGGTGRTRFEDDFQDGWECNSGIPDDPACIEMDPPDALDHVRRLVFYSNITCTPNCGAGNDWASSAPPYNGACNSCHTRASHHRRDDSVGGDHSHNVDKACSQCHNHNAGWVNKGG
ncbi:MAG: hypothetical protein OEU09_09080 [Rhodospirillales bacterium]|nr:hypothetical protein [Rhodospirillales bacterium]MDH3911437.1 hypothetical protein [Rhodospirillales bacterium]MDH3919122.1 hypothetical protein [Rhodospirillales bacterium]MDH3966105.1 hypothetical protein [Rhodospirillales bacterium]